MVDVKGRVLDSLGHDRSGDLLELAGESLLLGPIILADKVGRITQNHVADETKDAAAQERVAYPCHPHGRLDIAPIGRARSGRVDVRAINGEAGDHFAQRVSERIESKVARAPRLLSQSVELMRQHVQLARQRHLHDQQLLAIDKFGERHGVRNKFAVEPADPLDLAAIHEQAVDLVEEVVAAGAVDRPGWNELLTRAQDLFDDDVERRVDATLAPAGASAAARRSRMCRSTSFQSTASSSPSASKACRARARIAWSWSLRK